MRSSFETLYRRGQAYGPPRPGLEAVYLITHKATGMQYVGCSRYVYLRWRQHQLGATSRVLRPVMEREGPEAFSFKILAWGDKGGPAREREEIIARRTIWPEGFNIKVPAGYPLGDHP